MGSITIIQDSPVVGHNTITLVNAVAEFNAIIQVSAVGGTNASIQVRALEGSDAIIHYTGKCFGGIQCFQIIAVVESNTNMQVSAVVT